MKLLTLSVLISAILCLNSSITHIHAFTIINSKFGNSPKFAKIRNPTKINVSADIVRKDDVTQTKNVDDQFKPIGSQNSWEVHKFGGASLATAELYRTVGDLLIKESAGREGTNGPSIPTMAVVSARGGMTDLLVNVVDSALQDFEQAKISLDKAVESAISLLKELAPAEITSPIEARFRSDSQDILSVVQSLRMLSTVPDVTMEVVTGFGEIWSAQTLHAYLQTTGVSCDWIDARDILVVKSDKFGLGEKGAASTGGVIPLYEHTVPKMAKWFEDTHIFDGMDYSKGAPVVVVTGFVAKTLEGVPTTLKRSGSDYSATIFAKLINAGRVTMWKNTNGVYTADPRRVPEAFPISSLKYDEAMELAYFGAQVLHPSAMEPCIAANIPVYVRNIFNPSFEGTVIQGRSPSLYEAEQIYDVKNWRSKSGIVPIKGITSVDKTALVTLEGASIIGGPKAAARFMGAMSEADITVLIITQASSESSITIVVPEKDGKKAVRVLKEAFELELSRSTINSVSLVNGMSIVAIVGEGMAFTSGVSSTFMTSLARANCNIRLIAQGSSERQIAVVVKKEDVSRALRAAHMAFTLSETTACVAVLGVTGMIGKAFAKQLIGQEEMLHKDLGVKMCVTVAANQRKMILGTDSHGLSAKRMGKLDTLLQSDAALPFDLSELTNIMSNEVHPLRVIIDCTNSEVVSEYYELWLKNGINIISPSKRVSAGDPERYERVLRAQDESSANWQFESAVGAALPICTTLRDLFETGDKVERISGCVSGSMAFVLSTFSDKVPFSEAVKLAAEQAITENDLRVDLSGKDMAEKVVVLARLLGMDVNLEDVEVESLVPAEIEKKEYPGQRLAMNEIIVEDLKSIDALMLERLEAAKTNDCVLRYKFVIEKESNKCKCWLEGVSKEDPLFRLKLKENLVAFETSRYKTSPLIVKGAAAGPDLSAAGIFSDLLRLTRAYSSSND